jgi:hypothetical protein
MQQRMDAKLKGRLERGKPGAVRIIDGMATVTEQGLEYEADHTHGEILMKLASINGASKGVVTPGAKASERVGLGWGWGSARRTKRWRHFVPSGAGERQQSRSIPG